MPRAVFRRMVRGVSTRDYEAAIDVSRDGLGVARLSVSRGFVRAPSAGVGLWPSGGSTASGSPRL